MGCISSYSEKLVAVICDRLADGESLRKICADPKMPSRNAVRNWLIVHEDFRAKYYLARDEQADTIFDEMLDIADTVKLGVKTVTSPRGVEYTEADMTEHRKLQISARQWVLGKMRPKKYGELIRQESSGPDGGPVETKLIIYSGVLAEDDAKV